MEQTYAASDETWTETATFSTAHSRVRSERSRPTTCARGLLPVMRTSRTLKNPGRRFWRCSSPQGQQCRYYYWIDPKVAGPVKDYVNDLTKRIKILERDVHQSERMKRVMVVCVMVSWIITICCVCSM